MKNVLFIDQAYVIRFSQINGTTDQDYLEPAIRLGQLKHVRKYLGKCLYEKLIGLVENQDLTDNTSINHIDNRSYKTLLDDYIMDVTLYWTLTELLVYLAWKIDNANVQKRVPQDTESLSRGELADFIDIERSNAQEFTDDLLKYLKSPTGSEAIPEWSNCNDCNDDRQNEVEWSGIEIG